MCYSIIFISPFPFYLAVQVMSRLFDSRSLSTSIPFAHAFITNNTIYKDTIDIFAEKLLKNEFLILLGMFLPGKVLKELNDQGKYSANSLFNEIQERLQNKFPENCYNMDVREKDVVLNRILKGWTKKVNNSFKLFKKVLSIMDTNFDFEIAACKLIIILILKLNNVTLFRCSKPTDNDEQNDILCKICKEDHFWK